MHKFLKLMMNLYWSLLGSLTVFGLTIFGVGVSGSAHYWYGYLPHAIERSVIAFLVILILCFLQRYSSRRAKAAASQAQALDDSAAVGVAPRPNPFKAMLPEFVAALLIPLAGYIFLSALI